MSIDETLLSLFFSKPKDVDRFEKDYNSFHKELQSFEKIRKSHHNKLLKLPLNLIFIHWLKNLGKESSVKKHSKNLMTLIEEKLIPTPNEALEALVKKNVRTIYERIRSHKKFTDLEKESLCSTLQEFSNDLECLLEGSINFSPDPMQILTQNKKVPHTQFLRFIEPLSDRDQLIAKVLYYGEPTLEETLELTHDKILFKQSAIQFHKEVVSYPKHIIQELKEVTKNKTAKSLVFTNQKGKQIERPHLNNCFERASQRLDLKERITPKDLVRSCLPTFQN
ncbi:MAG: hypothetical protein S4CHLAM7_02140 [Chlamydiae bacterium]|nr:hypothetical protein [Chlamydiota bacterium]